MESASGAHGEDLADLERLSTRVAASRQLKVEEVAEHPADGEEGLG